MSGLLHYLATEVTDASGKKILMIDRVVEEKGLEDDNEECRFYGIENTDFRLEPVKINKNLREELKDHQGESYTFDITTSVTPEGEKLLIARSKDRPTMKGKGIIVDLGLSPK